MTAQLEGAVAEHEAARAELGDVLQAWQRDREELAEQIRWAVGDFGACYGDFVQCSSCCWGRPLSGPSDIHSTCAAVSLPCQGPALQPGAQDAGH